MKLKTIYKVPWEHIRGRKGAGHAWRGGPKDALYIVSRTARSLNKFIKKFCFLCPKSMFWYFNKEKKNKYAFTSKLFSSSFFIFRKEEQRSLRFERTNSDGIASLTKSALSCLLLCVLTSHLEGITLGGHSSPPPAFLLSSCRTLRSSRYLFQTKELGCWFQAGILELNPFTFKN